MVYQERAYRNYVKAANLVKFEVIEKESDLLILAEKNLYDKALAFILKYRTELEKYIASDPAFFKTYSPHRVRYDAPPIAKEMAAAARRAKVGPMAAVAGAIAEFVGKELRQFTDEIIVENGGDIFLKINQVRKAGIYAGGSPFSEKIALELEPRPSRSPSAPLPARSVILSASARPTRWWSLPAAPSWPMPRRPLSAMWSRK